jgi:hypothetical protein
MAENQTAPIVETPPGAEGAAVVADIATITAPTQVATTPTGAAPISGAPPEGNPAPPGTTPGAAPLSGTDVATDSKEGVGIEGEVVVWEARYSMKNFVGRLVGFGVLAIAWIALAVWNWGFEHAEVSLNLLTILLGIVLLVLGLNLLYRILAARFGHYYRLTTRRLFVSSGIFDRRRDMTELLKVDDVYTKQTLTGRWLSVGTVVVVSKDPKLPMLYLTGVDDPKGVMDMIWHYARAERDQKSVRVDSV